jgi:hypothetical protein
MDKAHAAEFVKVVQSSGDLNDDVGSKRDGKEMFLHVREQMVQGETVDEFLDEIGGWALVDTGEGAGDAGVRENFGDVGFVLKTFLVLKDLGGGEARFWITEALHNVEVLTVLVAREGEIDTSHATLAKGVDEDIGTEQAREGAFGRESLRLFIC